MPDMDSSRISGILEQSPATSGVVVGLHLSKRPRDEGTPTPGKRGRGENGDISLTLQIPVPVLAVASAGNGSTPQPPAPLCESPIANQAHHSSGTTHSHASAPLSSDSSSINSSASKQSDRAATSVASPAAAAAAAVAAISGVGSPTGRRKNRVPVTAPPSLGATDPIFHVALLRVLNRRGGSVCPEALGWRWSGDNPARFEHWPCALHPALMDLLACVSAGEERVLLTGCDVNRSLCPEIDEERPQRKQEPPPLAPPPPAAVCPDRETAWRAPLPRTPSRRNQPVGADLPLPATPLASPRVTRSNSASTPLSALRRPGSSRRSSQRVRFSTHDMSVVDTPDPARGGSEKGMVSALGGLEAILSAAEQLRSLATRARLADRSSSRGSRKQCDGYFDRFRVAGGGEAMGEDGHNGAASSPSGPSHSQPISSDGLRDKGSSIEELESVAERRECQVVAARERAAAVSDSLNEDACALVSALHEIASSESAPEELLLADGWGSEHSNAAAFYSTELASLCGTEDESLAREMAPLGVAGSHLRLRYLDVLSCLLRYNLKLLLNVCACESPEADPYGSVCTGTSEDAGGLEMDSDDDDSESGENAPLPSTALTVVVPGRTASSVIEAGGVDAAWQSSATAQAERGCGCVTVLDGTGALEFNTEDVAALLTLALARVHPFLPLTARLAVMAAVEEDGGGGRRPAGNDDDDDDDVVDAKVWSFVLQFTLDCRAAAAGAAAASAATKSVEDSPAAHLFLGVAQASASGPPMRPAIDEGPEAGGGAEESTSPAPSSPGAASDTEETCCLTADEIADLLEYVAATRFIAQLVAEPVVTAGISAGRWEATARLAEQVRKIAEAEEVAAAATASRESSIPNAATSLNNVLCLGALADIQGLGVTMAQQSRHAPALEARLRGELRRAIRRGQGSRQRRLKSRLQQAAMPDVFTFPMVTPCCNLAVGGGMV